MTAEETAAKIISKVGLWWPLAEEDQLRRAAGAYEQCGKAVRAAAATGTSGAKLVTGAPNKGDAIDAFASFWKKYDGDGNAGLPATASAADTVAAALREFADKVDEAKKKIINLAIEIGATIAVGVGLAFFTFGTSAGAAAARTAMLVARGVTIALGLSGVASTIVATMLVGAVFGAVEGFAAGIVAQVGKQVLNDGPGITLAETMSWTAFGAAGGAAFAGLGLAARSGFYKLRPGLGSGKPQPALNFKPPSNPPQFPPKTIPPGWILRVMRPTKQYPDGYWTLGKPDPNTGGLQWIDPSTMKPGKIKGGADTHIPLPPPRWPAGTGLGGGSLGNLGAQGQHQGPAIPAVR